MKNTKGVEVDDIPTGINLQTGELYYIKFTEFTKEVWELLTSGQAGRNKLQKKYHHQYDVIVRSHNNEGAEMDSAFTKDIKSAVLHIDLALSTLPIRKQAPEQEELEKTKAALQRLLPETVEDIADEIEARNKHNPPHCYDIDLKDIADRLRKANKGA